MRHAEDGRTACHEYEARLEDFLDGGADAAPDVAAHLERCARCREAMEAARLSRELLLEGLETAPAPAGAFATRVLAGIRAEESRRLAAGEFWRPLERLASRLALTAAAVLLVLSVYLYEFAPQRNRSQFSTQTEATEGFPEPAIEPASQDEVLLSLSENVHGR